MKVKKMNEQRKRGNEKNAVCRAGLEQKILPAILRPALRGVGAWGVRISINHSLLIIEIHLSGLD